MKGLAPGVAGPVRAAGLAPRRLLVAQLVAYLLMASIANGLRSLWPVYIGWLGGDPAFIGYYTALGTLALTIGTVVAGWLADRLQRQRLLFFLACCLLTASLGLMNRTTSLLQLTALNCVYGFATGAGYILVTVLAGLAAPKAERGKLFGMLALVSSASAVVGGFVSGPIVDRWGFPLLFRIAALAAGGCLVIGLYFKDASTPRTSQAEAQRRAVDRVALGRNFPFFLAAALFSSSAYVMSYLGLLVTMNRLGFTATSISTTIAIGGLVSMPGSLLMGWLSDRTGRKRLVLACYAAGLISLLVLAWSRSLGSFWCASVLLAILSSSSAAGSALVANSLPAQSLGTGLSLTAGASNLGGFFASPVMGLALQQWGQPNAFLVSLVVPIIAIAVFLPIREGYAA